MKKKLTLTLEESVIIRAKEIAREGNTSVSHLVETHFAAIDSNEPDFVTKWKGAFLPAVESKDDDRLNHLLSKHLKPVAGGN